MTKGWIFLCRLALASKYFHSVCSHFHISTWSSLGFSCSCHLPCRRESAWVWFLCVSENPGWSAKFFELDLNSLGVGWEGELTGRRMCSLVFLWALVWLLGDPAAFGPEQSQWALCRPRWEWRYSWEREAFFLKFATHRVKFVRSDACCLSKILLPVAFRLKNNFLGMVWTCRVWFFGNGCVSDPWSGMLKRILACVM